MRIALLLMMLVDSGWASMLGTWKMDSARSSFTGATPPKSLTVRIEPHARGEVFTLDGIEADRRATSWSTILYLDNTPRDIQDFECSGARASRWLRDLSIEIRRVCATSEPTWLMHRPAETSNELTVEITEGP